MAKTAKKTAKKTPKRKARRGGKDFDLSKLLGPELHQEVRNLVEQHPPPTGEAGAESPDAHADKVASKIARKRGLSQRILSAVSSHDIAKVYLC